MSESLLCDVVSLTTCFWCISGNLFQQPDSFAASGRNWLSLFLFWLGKLDSLTWLFARWWENRTDNPFSVKSIIATSYKSNSTQRLASNCCRETKSSHQKGNKHLFWFRLTEEWTRTRRPALLVGYSWSILLQSEGKDLTVRAQSERKNNGNLP